MAACITHRRRDLKTILFFVDPDCRPRRLAGHSDLGLDTENDVAKNRGLLRAGLAGADRVGHSGIQSVYLFHFLTCAHTAKSQTNRSILCRATASRRRRRTGKCRAKKKRSWL